MRYPRVRLSESVSDVLGNIRLESRQKAFAIQIINHWDRRRSQVHALDGIQSISLIKLSWLVSIWIFRVVMRCTDFPILLVESTS